MWDLAVNLLASVVAGLAAWLGQQLLGYRRLARRRVFFGAGPGEDVLLVVARHYASPAPESVHRRDVAALVELATIVRDCGGRANLLTDVTPREVGRTTEFCVGGPLTNPRTGAHLRSVLVGVSFVELTEGFRDSLIVGAEVFPPASGEATHALVAKVVLPDARKPLFVIAGQTALANLAAARFLAASHKKLIREYGLRRSFALVLRASEPYAYGPDHVTVASDVTEVAFGSGERERRLPPPREARQLDPVDPLDPPEAAPAGSHQP